MKRIVLPAVLSLALLVSACGGDDSSDTTTTTGAPEPTTTTSTSTTVPLDVPNQTAKSQVSESAHLVDVKFGEVTATYSVAFAFTEGAPGYDIGYAQMPPRQDGSGTEVPLKGAAGVSVRFDPASTVQLTGGFKRTYTGPETLTGSKDAPIVEVKKISDLEGTMVWAIGLDKKRPFTVSTEKLADRTQVTITFN